MQGLDAAGKQFMFQTREGREVSKMNRVAGLADRAAAQEMQANSDRTAALTGMISGLGSLASAGMGAAATKEVGKMTNQIGKYKID